MILVWITIKVVLIQLQRLAPRDTCLAAAPNSSRRLSSSPPRNSETSTPPAEAKIASLPESPVSAFLGSLLYFSFSILPMKSKSDFTVRPFDGHDVLVPTLPQDVAILVGQCFSGLNEALALFVLVYLFGGSSG